MSDVIDGVQEIDAANARISDLTTERDAANVRCADAEAESDLYIAENARLRKALAESFAERDALALQVGALRGALVNLIAATEVLPVPDWADTSLSVPAYRHARATLAAPAPDADRVSAAIRLAEAVVADEDMEVGVTQRETVHTVWNELKLANAAYRAARAKAEQQKGSE